MKIHKQLIIYSFVLFTFLILALYKCDDDSQSAKSSVISGGGGGSEIADEEGLKAIEVDCDNCAYVLSGDITLTTSWEPLGTEANPFMGTFDGKGYNINGLSVVMAPNVGYAGMFGYIGSTGVVKDLTIISPTVGGGSAQGALAAVNEGTITGVGVEGGTITGTNFDTGGLVGKNYGAINNSFSSASVSGKNNVGGLVGYNLDTGNITGSYSSGTIDAMNNVGGLVGNNLNTAVINSSYATGLITANNNVGGLVGYNLDTAVINSSYATGLITANNNVGGLVGLNSLIDHDNGIVEKSHFDIAGTGKASGVGDSSVVGIIGVSAAANILKVGNDYQDTGNSNQILFTSWVFGSVWTSVASGWPTLSWQN